MCVWDSCLRAPRCQTSGSYSGKACPGMTSHAIIAAPAAAPGYQSVQSATAGLLAYTLPEKGPLRHDCCACSYSCALGAMSELPPPIYQSLCPNCNMLPLKPAKRTQNNSRRAVIAAYAAVLVGSAVTLPLPALLSCTLPKLYLSPDTSQLYSPGEEGQSSAGASDPRYSRAAHESQTCAPCAVRCLTTACCLL